MSDELPDPKDWGIRGDTYDGHWVASDSDPQVYLEDNEVLELYQRAFKEIERLRAEVADARECAKSMFPFTQFHNEPYRSEWLEGFPWLNEKTNP